MTRRVAANLGEAERHRGGCHQAAEKRGQAHAPLGAGRLHGEIAAERDRGDEHHHPPNFVRIEKPPRTVTLIRQHGEQHHRDQQHLKHGVEIFLIELTHPLVQDGFYPEQRGGDDRDRSHEDDVSLSRGGAQHESQQCGDGGGDAVIAQANGFGHLGRRKHHGEAEKRKPEKQQSGFVQQQPPARAEQRDEGEAADAGHPTAVLRVAALPSALHADEQPRGHGHCDTEEKIVLAHEGSAVIAPSLAVHALSRRGPPVRPETVGYLRPCPAGFDPLLVPATS